MRGNERSPVAVLIFSIITCGIYYIYWLYSITKEIKNFTKREDINPTIEVILCLVTCGIYQIYWWYKYGKIVTTDMYSQVGLNHEDNSTLLMVLSIFGLCLVSALIMQDTLNVIWKKIENKN